MKLSHPLVATSAVFDDPNLVSSGGLVPVLALAESAGLRDLADEHLTVPTDKGANAGLKVSSLVAGMVAGADSIDDMAMLRHGGMGRIFARAYAPSTLGSFLRAFAFGHVRQLDAVASRFLTALVGLTRLLGDRDADQDRFTGGVAGYALLDVDDTIIEVHGQAKQGAGFGYSGVRGLNALLATLATARTAPVIVAQRLRKGACGSPRGAKRLVADAVKQARRLLGPSARVLVRMDSALCRHRHKAESIRTSGLLVASGLRSRLTWLKASATSRLAPRGEPQAPLRSRWVRTTGAVCLVVTVANAVLSPRTPEYP